MRAPLVRVRRVGCAGERGQAMAEFALAAVPLFLMVMGILDLGRAVLFQNALQSATIEAARAGSVASRSADDICATASAAAHLPGVTPGTGCGTTSDGNGALFTVAVPQRGVAGDATQPVRVTATYAFRCVTPLIGTIIGNPLTLTGSATMYVEY